MKIQVAAVQDQVPVVPDFPGRITLELTNACNLHCSMCPSRLGAGGDKGMMDPALFRRVVDEAAQSGGAALVPFFRGESLLHPDLVSLLAYAKKRGLGPLQLVTNGLRLNEEMSRRLLATGLDFISFSLDTLRPGEYERIRQGSDFLRVMANVLGFVEMRNAGGYATEIQVSATRVKHNRDSLEEFVAFWRHKVDRTRIYYEHSADGHPGSLDCPEVPQGMARRPCHKPFSDLVVYYDGRLALCNHDWQRDGGLGSLQDQSVAQAWRSAAYRELRRQHLRPQELSDPTCRHCDHWKMYYLPQGFIGELYTPQREVRRAV